MKESRSSIYIEKLEVVKAYLSYKKETFKAYINRLIADDIKNHAPEETVIKYFKGI